MKLYQAVYIHTSKMELTDIYISFCPSTVHKRASRVLEQFKNSENKSLNAVVGYRVQELKTY